MSATPPALPALPAAFVEMMAKGVSAIVGSRDLALKPSIMRAVGSQVEDQGRRITVYLARSQSRQLLQDIAATGWVTVVFSQPASHRTVQLKSRQAQLRAANAADVPVLARYLESMEYEIQRVGYPAPMTRAMLAHQLDDLVAVSFTPELAFDQTPGPQAGAALGGGAR